MPIAMITFSNEFAITPTRRHPKYHLEMVYICVQDTEFYLPKHHFQKESPYFRGLFVKMYADAVANPETQALFLPDSAVKATRKIYLKDTDPADFEHLVRVLYPYEWNDKFLDIEPRGWISILKLAHRWKFDRIRDLAISHIDELPKEGIISGFQLLSLYLKYGIRHWFPIALRMLCEEDLLKEDEAFQEVFVDEIGDEYTRRIIRLQGLVQGLHQAAQFKKDKNVKEAKVLDSEIETVIRKVFPELDANE